jgi:Sec-independent protein translocase protein TatA
MEFLGIGPLELLFIFLIALIFLGPRDIVKTGRTLGQFLNRVVKSPTWQAIKQTSREMRYLPNKLMREAGMEEQFKDFQEINREVQELKKISTPISYSGGDKEIREPSKDLSAWTTSPNEQNSSDHENPVIASPDPPKSIMPPDIPLEETSVPRDQTKTKTSSKMDEQS